MRWIAVVALVIACSSSGCSSSDRSTDAAIDTPIDTPVDVAIDGTPDFCLRCRSDELCVARYNGTCGLMSIECVVKAVDCPNNACTSTCEATYCPLPYQCRNRAPCGGESALAFTCYGP